MGRGGDGICDTAAGPVFVPYALPGESVTVDGTQILARQDVPAGHKIATRDVAVGESIKKYGMPIGAATTKTPKPDIFAVDFPIKPGDTRFDLTYSLPYTPGEPYKGKIVTKDENTYVIAPNGITLTGANLSDLGKEPRTQAHIYGLQGASYKVTLSGSEIAPPAASDSGVTPNELTVVALAPALINSATAVL